MRLSNRLIARIVSSLSACIRYVGTEVDAAVSVGSSLTRSAEFSLRIPFKKEDFPVLNPPPRATMFFPIMSLNTKKSSNCSYTSCKSKHRAGKSGGASISNAFGKSVLMIFSILWASSNSSSLSVFKAINFFTKENCFSISSRSCVSIYSSLCKNRIPRLESFISGSFPRKATLLKSILVLFFIHFLP